MTTPDDRRKARMKDFYFTIGVAVVQWHHVEDELTKLFCTLVGGESRVASAVFNTVPSFPTKLRMVKTAVLVRLGETDLFERCKRLCKYLDEDIEQKRNQIAHFKMYYDMPEDALEEKVDWYLAPSVFDAVRRRKGEPPLKVSDIENRTKEFAKASERIRDFTAQVKATLATP